MAKLYPIGIQNFESLRNDGYFYVDKTRLIYKLAWIKHPILHLDFIKDKNLSRGAHVSLHNGQVHLLTLPLRHHIFIHSLFSFFLYFLSPSLKCFHESIFVFVVDVIFIHK